MLSSRVEIVLSQKQHPTILTGFVQEVFSHPNGKAPYKKEML
jgi:hypothetical protein